MKNPEFMKMHKDKIPRDIFEKYNMNELRTKNGYVHFRINKGMYGLKHATILAYQQLKEHLVPHVYYPIPNTVGMWKHTFKPISFCLCVDDFGIKHLNKQDVQHLLDTLQQKYTVTTDWTGSNYCGLILKWDFRNCHVDISIPGYIDKLLKKLKHKKTTRPVHAPHKWSIPIFGQHDQQSIPDDSSNLLPKTKVKIVQSIVGALLYGTRDDDPSMNPALNKISITQATPANDTLEKCEQLLDYLSWNPNTTI